jgi:hypothetical protein
VASPKAGPKSRQPREVGAEGSASSRLKLKRLPSLEDIPLGPFLRKGIGIRIWQWIQILDYADSYAYFVDYDAEGSIALLLFKILYLYLELVHKSFPFMRFGRAWFPGIGYSWKK